MRRASFNLALFLLPVASLLPAGCTLLPAAREHPIAAEDEPRFVARAVPVKWALVLSSGAMRGFAHIGVIRELRAAGLEPDLIVGTSVGAAVGALAASGLDGEQLAEAGQAIGMNVFGDLRLSRFGVIGGGGIHEFIDRFSRYHSIEEFPIRFAAVAVEAERSCLEIFNAGDAGKTVQASSGVPVVFSPASIRGHRYLDGALLSPLPVRVARALGAQRVVAVDVVFDPKERPFSNMVESFWRISLVTQWALTANEAADADIVLRPALPPEGMITFSRRDALIEAGARTTRENLSRISRLLALDPPSRDRLHSTLEKLMCPETHAALRGPGVSVQP
jgi:NTE family protein